MKKIATFILVALHLALVAPVAHAQSTAAKPLAFVSVAIQVPGNNKNKDKICTGAVISTSGGGGSCGISKN